jgi:hypothetical protein
MGFPVSLPPALTRVDPPVLSPRLAVDRLGAPPAFVSTGSPSSSPSPPQEDRGTLHVAASIAATAACRRSPIGYLGGWTVCGADSAPSIGRLRGTDHECRSVESAPSEGVTNYRHECSRVNLGGAVDVPNPEHTTDIRAIIFAFGLTRDGFSMIHAQPTGERRQRGVGATSLAHHATFARKRIVLSAGTNDEPERNAMHAGYSSGMASRTLSAKKCSVPARTLLSTGAAGALCSMRIRPLVTANRVSFVSRSRSSPKTQVRRWRPRRRGVRCELHR